MINETLIFFRKNTVVITIALLSICVLVIIGGVPLLNYSESPDANYFIGTWNCFASSGVYDGNYVFYNDGRGYYKTSNIAFTPFVWTLDYSNEAFYTVYVYIPETTTTIVFAMYSNNLNKMYSNNVILFKVGEY